MCDSAFGWTKWCVISLLSPCAINVTIYCQSPRCGTIEGARPPCTAITITITITITTTIIIIIIVFIAITIIVLVIMIMIMTMRMVMILIMTTY